MIEYWHWVRFLIDAIKPLHWLYLCVTIRLQIEDEKQLISINHKQKPEISNDKLLWKRTHIGNGNGFVILDIFIIR